MKATIGKKQRYITITPTPKKDIVNGLVVYFSDSYQREDYEMPIAMTNINKGQRRYFLPKNGIMKVVKIQLCA